jgi:hypothetical protein
MSSFCVSKRCHVHKFIVKWWWTLGCSTIEVDVIKETWVEKIQQWLFNNNDSNFYRPRLIHHGHMVINKIFKQMWQKILARKTLQHVFTNSCKFSKQILAHYEHCEGNPISTNGWCTCITKKLSNIYTKSTHINGSKTGVANLWYTWTSSKSTCICGS